jgi:ATP-binding cassette subfamily B (MDR/TAP) protein 1
MGVGGALVGKAIAGGFKASQEAYSQAGAIAQETFVNIRTVAAYQGQERALSKFTALLDTAYDVGIKRSWKTGFGFGFFFGLLYGLFALAFW